MDEFENELDADDQFSELFEKVEKYEQACESRSAERVASEIRRLAKGEQKVIPYLTANFHLVNEAQGLLEPEQGRDVAIELIGLLESEELARRIQPDFPEDEFYFTTSWMTACGYDNLAKHTASLQGYNSEGMQSCISDGIGVCRRTGKLECITCFREYAFDVYLAADDVDIALHNARLVNSLAEDVPGAERRWVGAKHECWLHLLRGRMQEAEEAALKQFKLAETYHTPLDAQSDSKTRLEEVLLLAGKHDEFSTYADAPAADREKLKGQWTAMELHWDQRDALAACCRGDYQEAIRLLMHWDRWLAEHRCVSEWFEIRLRLIAAVRLAGRQDKVATLAGQLQQRAKKACDFLTLRRLERLVDPDEPVSPLATLGPLTAGPFASAKTSVQSEQLAAPSTEPDEATQDEQDTPTVTPLAERFDQLTSRFEAAFENEDDEQETAVKEILNDVLAIGPESVTHPIDAGKLIHFVSYLVGDFSRSTEIWHWSNAIASRFDQDAAVLSVLAVLGDNLNGGSETPIVDQQRIEKLFRHSLTLDAENPRNFARAGSYFLGEDNYGEAERCLARGFRLDRGNGFLALRLAEVYRQTDRPRDALAVLDMCLREGCEDANLAFDAAMSALNLEQFDALLTYADKVETLAPGENWTQYYRATALLELERPQEALTALEEEEKRGPDNTFHLEVLRTCATAALGDSDLCQEHLDRVLSQKLTEIDYLTQTGLVRLFERLWKSISKVRPPLRGNRKLIELLLTTGMAPDDLFEHQKGRDKPVEDLNFYVCTIRQPLDPNWSNFTGCLAGQESWTEYTIRWGVLAHTEEEAKASALGWQRRCFPLEPTIEEVELEGEDFTDVPGVVWQGFRWCEAEDEVDDDGEAD